MKKFKTFSFLTVLLILAVAVCALLCACDGDNDESDGSALTYTEIYEGNTVKGYGVRHNKSMFNKRETLEGSVEIPSSYNGKPVLVIENGAFMDHKAIVSVQIPESVVEIGQGAFQGCSALQSVTLPDSVRKIGGWAFFYCTALSEITFPKSVDIIGNYALAGCCGLEKITVNGNRYYHDDGNCLIETAAKSLIAGCKNSVIPNDGSVEKIADYAFSDCTDLTQIRIPQSVAQIGKDAFYGCAGLSAITVDKGNKTYHDDGNCLIETATKRLIVGCKNSVIPSDGSVTEIGDGAFSGCAELRKLTVPASVLTIASNAFYNCANLTDVELSATVRSIGGSAFANCASLNKIIIPSSVTEICDAAFMGCTGLSQIEYGGTKKDWENIAKEEDWAADTPNFTVTCMDGALEVKSDSDEGK